MPNGKCAHHGPLSSAQRKRLRPSDFALPKERKYPVPDVGHARAAKARASQQLERGNLTRAEYNRIVRKADTVIKACGGNPNDNPHGFWSTNPGTGWKIVGAVVGVAVVGGVSYGLYRYLKKPEGLPPGAVKKDAFECGKHRGHEWCLYEVHNRKGQYGFRIDGGELSGKRYWYEEAVREAKAAIDKLPPKPVPIEPDVPGPVDELGEPLEPEATEEEGPDVGPVLQPVVNRHGSTANPNTNEVLISSRDQWIDFASDFLKKRGFANLTADELVGIWSRAFPPSVGVGPGWRVAGRTWTDLQLGADRWLDDTSAGTYFVPVGFDMFKAGALVTLGETPPEWASFVADVKREDLYTAPRIGSDDHVVGVRYVEEKLPDQTDRYWQWLAWGPDEYQLRENNTMQTGRGSSRQDAVNKARDWVRTYPVALAVVATD